MTYPPPPPYQPPPGGTPPAPYSTFQSPLSPEPLNQAFQVMTQVCFRPFDWMKWLALGFIAFLSNCGRGGGGDFSPRMFGGFPTPPPPAPAPPVAVPPPAVPPGPGTPPTPPTWPPPSDPYGTDPGFPTEMPSTEEEVREVTDLILGFLGEYFVWILLGFAAFIFLMIAASALIAWLSARADFVLLDGIAWNRGLIADPWSNFAREGNSLFLVRFFILLLHVALFLVFFDLFFYFGLSILENPVMPSSSTIALVVAAFLLLVLASIPFALFKFFINNVSLPIMYARRLMAKQASGEGWRLLKDNFGKFALYLLVHIGFMMAFGVIRGILGCLLCCIGWIPVVKSILFLPLTVLSRAYNMTFIEQFGDQYKMIHVFDPVPMFPGMGMPMPSGAGAYPPMYPPGTMQAPPAYPPPGQWPTPPPPPQ